MPFIDHALIPHYAISNAFETKSDKHTHLTDDLEGGDDDDDTQTVIRPDAIPATSTATLQRPNRQALKHTAPDRERARRALRIAAHCRPSDDHGTCSDLKPLSST